MRQYPRWIHHPSGKSMIVNHADHERAQGPGWYDTPADFPKFVPHVEEPIAEAPRKPGRPPKVKE